MVLLLNLFNVGFLLRMIKHLLFSLIHRYEEAREEEKLRSQREDFSDMVAEVRYLKILLLTV